MTFVESEARYWLEKAPKEANGKVGFDVVIAEGQRRGYCICPKPMRAMVKFDGLRCKWCGQMETHQSWEFWHQLWEVPDE